MPRSRVGVLGAACAVAASLLVAPTAQAAEGSDFRPFPETISLPDGFQPEGIAIGPGPFAYFGSLADGSIYRANLITGAGTSIGDGPGTPSVGLATDRRGRLFVAGGPAGDARVLDTRSGEVLASYRLAADDVEGTFVNDVTLAGDAAYFTDSVNPVLYRLPLGSAGQLPDQAELERIPLKGDLVYQPGFNVNGITTAPGGDDLIVVQSNTGKLFRTDRETGVSKAIDLGGTTLPNGDGMLRIGHILYVVQNRLNQVAVVRLDGNAEHGRVVDEITSPGFDVPTTVARFGPRLYLPNARFGTPPQPTTEYTAVAVPRR